MIVPVRLSLAGRLWRWPSRWFRAQAVTLLRAAALLAVLAVTLVSGYVCHGLIGPPG